MVVQLSYPEPTTLWNLTSHEFNEWRSQNDIPKLFLYFKDILPGFINWLSHLPFSEEVALRIVPTGALFKGEGAKVVVRKSHGIPKLDEIVCIDSAATERLESFKMQYDVVDVLGEFEPYFLWAKRVLGRGRFFCYDKANRQMAENFRYGLWSGLHPSSRTSAHLFKNFPVLKLGQIALPAQALNGDRNLDFVDLDYLVIQGGYSGSIWREISYSSCREISFIDIEIAFFKFHRCVIGKFISKNSKLQDFYFDENLDYELKLELKDSFILKMEFRETAILPTIQNCELREFRFLPPSDKANLHIAAAFRLLRSAYQGVGMRREAAECYYQERTYERKSYFESNVAGQDVYRNISYRGKISQVINGYRSGYIERQDLHREIFRALMGCLKLLGRPRYVVAMLGFKIRWLISMVENIVWGYGERPSRILSAALFIIIGYAGAYYGLSWVERDGETSGLDFADSLYFSAITFTTLGYGDITPTSTLLKMICASEAILGALTMGLIVAGFSNRNKY